MSFSLPPVIKAAEGLQVAIEHAVRRMPRYHRYVAGKDLREQAMRTVRLAHRAWRDRPRQADWIGRLVWTVDDLKLSLQLCCNIRAFASFAQFKMLAELAADLGRQVGGWHRRQQHPEGQNAGAVNARPQRAKILSARAASRCEATP